MKRRTKVSLTTSTGADVATSRSLKSLPWTIGVP
jgi:hypothetical protein